MDNVLIAFLLTLLAGLATGIGSCIAFFAKKTNKKFLCISLGFSAGVMIYVSMIEIFQEAKDSLIGVMGLKMGSLVTVVSFFAGIAIIALIDKFVPKGENPHEARSVEDMNKISKDLKEESDRQLNWNEFNECVERNYGYDSKELSDDIDAAKEELYINSMVLKDTYGRDIKCIEGLNKINREENSIHRKAVNGNKKRSFFKRMFNLKNRDENLEKNKSIDGKSGNREIKDKMLLRTGVVTALAIAIHNFPEGLATFVSALDDATLAIPITVAIAIHNIPEGIAVSVPIYYATGNKKKAFVYSFLSGMSEPVGALIGYALLRNIFNDMTLGILLASVAGIMVFISLDELLPTARKYGEHHLSIYGLVAGMIVMAISLLLFL